MTAKAQKRAKVMELVIRKHITLKSASKLLSVSYRQALRIKEEYQENGDMGLNHKLIGKESNNKYSFDFKEKVLKAYTSRYSDFGPTLASEMMEKEYGLIINKETLRLWLNETGIHKSKKRKEYRTRRERKKCFGEMLQMDGSIHDWLENGEKICLLNCIDDATNETFGLFDTGETTEIALKVLHYWIMKYGIPMIIYTDYRTVYKSNREPSIEEQLQGIIPLTQFGRVCQILGIQLIFASSPQAKGRVERSNGILQDRLIKMMRLKEIKDIDLANAYLTTEFWNEYNDRFRKEPASDESAHVQLLEHQNLDDLISFEYERTISNDYVIRWNSRSFQLESKQDVSIYPRLKIKVHLWLDGSIHLFYKATELSFKELFASENELIYNTA